MNNSKKNIYGILLFLGIFILIGSIEYNLRFFKHGSLLFTLTFLVSIIEGVFALLSIGILSRANWIKPIEKYIFSLNKTLLYSSILFLLVYFELKIYPWYEKETFWLNDKFFIFRNFILLLATYIFSLKHSHAFAVLYLVVFVFSQSLIAFDWIMPLEYPWVSTLFGGYFFIESIYMGIALSAIICIVLVIKEKTNIEILENSLKNISTLMFGFSILWAGLFYSQFLVIWYGNIPEETFFILKRLTNSPVKEMAYLIIPCLFILPFIFLISKKAKTKKIIVFTTSLLIFFGIILERLVFIMPILNLNYSIISIEFFSLVLLLGYCFKF